MQFGWTDETVKQLFEQYQHHSSHFIHTDDLRTMRLEAISQLGNGVAAGISDAAWALAEIARTGTHFDRAAALSALGAFVPDAEGGQPARPWWLRTT